MAKVSWKFDKENAEVVGGYSTYEGDLPPKAIYRFRLKQLKLKMSGADPSKNKESNPMLNCLLEIEEPAKVNGKTNPKAKYNGYAIWWNGNVTDQGAGFLNGFLIAFGYDPKKFWNGDVIHDADGEPKPRGETHASYVVGTITKIGGKAVGAQEKGPVCSILIARDKPYQGEDRMKPASFLPPKGSASADDSDESEEDYEDEEEEIDDTEEEESEEDADEGEESEDPEYDAAVTELEGLTLAKLKARAKANGAKLADYKGLDENELIDLILEQEFPADEEVEEDEPEDEEEVEEEEEPEPEPTPARRVRAATRAKAAPAPAAKKAPARRAAAPAATARKAPARRTRGGEPPF